MTIWKRWFTLKQNTAKIAHLTKQEEWYVAMIVARCMDARYVKRQKEGARS